MDNNKSHISNDSKKATFNKEHLARDSMSKEWTNEKHSLYLKSMEASFVKDLYNSFDLFGYQVQNPSDSKFSGRKHTASRAPSGQFKVLHHGCWEKVSFERKTSRTQKVDETGVLLANPWIRHFRSSRQNVESSTPEEITLAADLTNYDSEEVTDQNFVDEEDLEDKANPTSSPKRIKTSIALSNDQVVPLDNFLECADVTDKS